MFCTSLRRRNSFAAIVPALTSNERLKLRENQLDTHDIQIPLQPTVNPQTGHTLYTRSLRLLLLSPTSARDSALDDTISRIQRLVALTGGGDLAIAFLLRPRKGSSFVSAKVLAASDGSVNADEEAGGMYAYTKLQATLFPDTSIPHVPILPLAEVEGLPDLLVKHAAALGRTGSSNQAAQYRVRQQNGVTPFDLLQICTAEPPMARHTALVLADTFANLAELAAACTSVASAPVRASQDGSSQASFASRLDTEWSTQASTNQDDYAGKLTKLRTLLGEQECQNVIDFWAEEWTL